MGRTSMTILGALVSTCLAGACGFDDGAGDVVQLRSPMATQMAAIVEGVVEARGSGCLLIGDRIIVWPADTEATKAGVRLADGTAVAAGDRIRASGGEISIDAVNELVDMPKLENCEFIGGVVLNPPVSVLSGD